MTPLSSCGLKIFPASEIVPLPKRGTPTIFWTFSSSVACWTIRSESQIGENMYSSMSERY